MLDDFQEEITDIPETTSAANLFIARENNEQELLDKIRDQAFHHTVMQLLFTGIQCRKDAHTAIALLTTRARKPDEDNWKKLRRLLGYLKRTIKLPPILRSDGVNAIKWWLDVLYAAHDDIRGHTGGTMSMGKDGRGPITSIPKKKKLNTNILTEAEIIGVDDAMPQMLCTR